MYCFLGAIVVRPCLVCFDSNLSKTDIILRENIISARDNADGVLIFGVILLPVKTTEGLFS